jgi:AcrR family transcriptional regulator
VQVKKQAVNDAILDSAKALFSTRGYNNTTLAAIADGSGIGVGSIYSYFPSKLHILYQIYRPWLQGCIEELAREIHALASPRQKLRRLLLGIWRDIPARNTGLANSLMEALASGPKEDKPDDLLRWTERRLTELLCEALPTQRRHLLKGDFVSHLFLMAYDGFVINRRLGDTRDVEALVDTVCAVMLSSAAARRRYVAGSGRKRGKPQAKRSRKTA